jgi:ATP-dependent Clp protease ATP-binding subunit ClpB
MNIEKYSERVRGFIQSAQSYALAEGHQQFMPEHLLKVFMDDDQGMASSLIERAGGRPADVRLANDAAIAKLPKVSGATVSFICRSRWPRCFQSAEEAAKKAGDSFVTVERLLLALVIEASAETSKILSNAG